MKKTILWFLIPVVLVLLFSSTQFMTPVTIKEISLMIIGSVALGSFIGAVFYGLNKFFQKLTTN
ncbi:hypothetical protein QUF81_07415 [Peribacillus simplex]|uniref:DUF1049 domain-containing protein n=1 Tax=Peribacillus simplex TaxID=1478 RepID=A0AAW7IED7_9BACI|nr:hypothetical protein [Peribacillus simplex]AMM94662.1 hypothetical protein UP17_21115 [Peribacillus simplex]MDM5293024.1 hypothetical protein [Peribacillus simplex]MDM5451899.1 hypothetical protein [Peribacillus simplex]